MDMTDLSKWVPQAGARPTCPPTSRAATSPRLQALWARHEDDVRAAQRLRYRVFSLEMGAQLPQMTGAQEGHDIDIYDRFCEHLLIRTVATGDQPSQVVGTYRVLTPGGARQVGGLYTDTEFDLVRLRQLRPRIAELGRSCIDERWRTGGVIMPLWRALAGFMVQNNLDIMIGCASIPMQHQGPHGVVGGGHAAAGIWRQVRERHMASVEFHVRPRLPLPVDQLDSSLAVDPPALIKGYLRLGAKVLGAPAWDPDFNAADLPMMMRLADMPPRYRRHLLGA